MKKRDYFIEALKAQAYCHKAWVLHCFSKTRLDKQETIPYRLYEGTEQYYYYPDNNPDNDPVYLEDTDVNKPPFHFRQAIDLTPDDVVNLQEPVSSDYGKLLANTIALVYPLGDKIAYINTEFNIKAVEATIAARLTTDPEYQKKDSRKIKDPIYVSEYLNFIDAILTMEGYSQLCVPSATEKTMTRSPEIPKRRAELIEKYKDRLNDPAVVAQIEAELIQMDKDWMKGDLGEGFFRKSKSYDTVRKKTQIWYGYESGFDMDPSTITKSLSEGWDIDKLPAMVNALREGSYGRGKMTEKGGEATKTMNRMMQNTKTVNKDCGTQLGWERVVDNDLIGFYYFDRSGKTVLIDQDNIQTLKGQTVTVRSPQFCHAQGVRFCRYCIGEPNGENEEALSAHASAVTSQLMALSMASAHSVALKTSKYDKKVCIK